MPVHLSRIIPLLLILFLLGSFFGQTQNWDAPPKTQRWEEELPSPPSPFPCAAKDEDIFREPSRTGHKVSQGLVDLLDTIGYWLLCMGWLFAAGLLYLIIKWLKTSFVVWIFLWLPLCLVALVAYSPLQAYRARLQDLAVFQRECRPFQPPSAAFRQYQMRRLGDALPYLGMLMAITLLYIPAINRVVKAQRNKGFQASA